MNRAEIVSNLQKILSPSRLTHSLGVEETAIKLAPRFKVDPEEAGLAGLMHDLCREISGDLLLQLAVKFGIVIDNIEHAEPVLLHGAVGAAMVREEFGITAPAVLEAITFHVTGSDGIGTLARLIFVADYIEPGRSFETSRRLNKLSEHLTLDDLLLEVYDSTITYLVHRGFLIHPRTTAGRNELLLNRGYMKGED